MINLKRLEVYFVPTIETCTILQVKNFVSNLIASPKRSTDTQSLVHLFLSNFTTGFKLFPSFSLFLQKRRRFQAFTSMLNIHRLGHSPTFTGKLQPTRHLLQHAINTWISHWSFNRRRSRHPASIYSIQTGDDLR